MSYLALARKWRPRSFEDVVGQPHIVRALKNALGSGRIHHAFLFAGTRGVGKTTVARIFARCLNCEQGVTATPCGTCRACVAIEEGRFVDLLEVDAASRTGIDDMRELLDNVQYTPSAGRYKVYLVDEVHMLSKQAFNALLKTLEEPPPHVKFLFATTDPQKLPVTVLSRCLQFNLKRLPNALIIDRMAKICAAEGLAADPGALVRIARAAAGSMRDALSLLDQALAFGNEKLTDEDVAEMLGSLDRSRVIGLLQLLAQGYAGKVLAYLGELDELAPDYPSLLDDLATQFQQIAVLQLAGSDALEDEDHLPELAVLAQTLDAETVQLDYQIAVMARRDIGLAPDPRIGFQMAMLRILAFRPAGAAAAIAPTAAIPPATAATGRAPAAGPVARPAANSAAGPTPSPTPSPAAAPLRAEAAAMNDPAEWPAFAAGLALDGAARQLAMHTQLLSRSPAELKLGIERANAHLITEQLKSRLTAAIHERLGERPSVKLAIHDRTPETIAAKAEQSESDAMHRAREAIEADPNVRDLASVFGAQIVPDSIKPLAPDTRKKRAE